MQENIEERYAIKFCVKLNKSVTETFASLTEAYGDVISVRDFLTIGHVLALGRWITWSSWRTSLLCMWGGKGRVIVLFRRPIRCRYYCISDSLLGLLLRVSPAKSDKWPKRQQFFPLQSESFALTFFSKFLSYPFFTCLTDLYFVLTVFFRVTFYEGA